MASISNTGKSITLAFTDAEKNSLMERGGDDWHWQIPEFKINRDGTGTLTLQADMFKGRKIVKMSGVDDRWMLVIPPKAMPLMPYFKRIMVELNFDSPDAKITTVAIPRDLPMLGERKIKEARNAAHKPVAKLVEPSTAFEKIASGLEDAIAYGDGDTSRGVIATASPIIVGPEGNLTLVIEGQSFVYNLPLAERLRLIGELVKYEVV